MASLRSTGSIPTGFQWATSPRRSDGPRNRNEFTVGPPPPYEMLPQSRVVGGRDLSSDGVGAVEFGQISEEPLHRFTACAKRSAHPKRLKSDAPKPIRAGEYVTMGCMNYIPKRLVR